MRTLTMALAHYDRHVPLLEGDVGVDGVELRAMEVGQSVAGRHGSDRHERMLQHGEFDCAEVSLSSFLMARDRGLPFTAIPVFPRRLFSLSQMWCRRAAGIAAPRDLVGRRIGLNTFQTTLSVLAKGDLQRSYDVPWRSVRWVVSRDETIAFEPPPGVSLERAPAGSRLADLLLKGDIDGVFLPHPPRAVLDSPEHVGRLFADPRAEERRYFETNGYFPIMHVVAFRDDVLRETPSLARATFAAFQQAWELCRERWDDPDWSWLAWGRHAFEEERQVLPGAWDNGLRRNRANLQWFLEQSRDQGLIGPSLSVESLFVPELLDT